MFEVKIIRSRYPHHLLWVHFQCAEGGQWIVTFYYMQCVVLYQFFSPQEPWNTVSLVFSWKKRKLVVWNVSVSLFNKLCKMFSLFFSQVIIRSRCLRENGKYIPKQSFLMRRQFFNSEEAGYFKTQKRAAVNQNPMTDPNMMTDMLKGNVTNVLPMIVIGGWINWMFSGFVTSELTDFY